MGWRAAALLIPAAATVTLVLGLFDRVTVASHAALARLTFGHPLAWLSQDQSSLEPPIPATMRFVSPWEHPASVALVPLLLDVLIACAVLLAGLLAVRFVRARLSP